MKNILIINDFVSLGKIAGKMMETVLSYKGHNTFFLPTALIANNFSYGKNAILDTTDYLKDTLRNRDEIGFEFDLISIGYIHNTEQRDIIYDYVKNLDYKATVLFDPIMGDDGSLYPTLDETMLENYKSLLDISDIISPNATEAKFLDIDYEDFTRRGKKYLITSIEEDGKYFVKGYDEDEFKVPFDKLPKRLTGTGDLFDGLFIAYFLDGYSIEKSCQKTVDIISKIYKDVIEYSTNENINIERYLDLID